MLITKGDGTPIATKMTRVVHGGRGDYIEIHNHDILLENIHVPADQAWRKTSDWRQKVFYEWWAAPDGTKLYYQKKVVDYADYKVGYWYVAPDLVEEVDDEFFAEEQ